MTIIAERRLIAWHPKHGQTSVLLQIFTPRPHPEGDWCCDYHIEGLHDWDGAHTLIGIDSWQAVCLCIKMVRTVMKHQAGEGTVFMLDDEGDEIENNECLW